MHQGGACLSSPQLPGPLSISNQQNPRPSTLCLLERIPFIDAILLRDENEPRKQRHTAHRIWTRICEELPQVGVAESSIRRYVRERKIELNLTPRWSPQNRPCVDV